jgi:hypothetical protein
MITGPDHKIYSIILTASTMKIVKYNSNGGRLWIDIEMYGLYFISYTYQLWSASVTEPPVLTNPLKNGNNSSPHDDYFPVINDYNPTEPLSQYDNRGAEVRLWIKKVNDDNGYHLKAVIYQGNDYDTAIELGSDELNGTLNGLSVKMESLLLKLKAE